MQARLHLQDCSGPLVERINYTKEKVADSIDHWLRYGGGAPCLFLRPSQNPSRLVAGPGCCNFMAARWAAEGRGGGGTPAMEGRQTSGAWAAAGPSRNSCSARMSRD
jgi:hypothetical protein